MRRLGLTFVPAQPLELQPLHLPAMRAGHEIPPLIGCFVLAFDPRQTVNGRRRAEQDLGAPRECARPCLGERNRIAFLVGRGRIGIDLVEEEVARRHRAQADRAVRTRDNQEPCRKLLRQHRVAGITRARGLDPFAQRRALGNQRLDALAREALGKLDGRLHREHRSGRVMDDVADPVVAAFGEADLGRFHHDDAAHRMHRRQRVNDLPHVGRTIGAVAPRLCGSPRAQHPVLIGPFGDRQCRIGQKPVAPGLGELLRAVEDEQVT